MKESMRERESDRESMMTRESKRAGERERKEKSFQLTTPVKTTSSINRHRQERNENTTKSRSWACSLIIRTVTEIEENQRWCPEPEEI